MSKFLEDAVAHVSEQVQRQKEELIQTALIEKGVALDLAEMLKNPPRFTRLLAQHHENYGDFYYYDDGSHNGLFIIGFKDSALRYGWEDLNTRGKYTWEFTVITEEPEHLKKVKRC